MGTSGNFVTMNSESFDIILNILIGIRRCLGNLSDGLPNTRLDNWQFQKVLCMESDWMSSSARKPTLFRFYDYAPVVFQKIRSLSGIKEDDYARSIGPEQIINSLWTNNMETLYELCSSGKSGALFYFTKDKKYLLKTIPEREFVKLRAVLKDYTEHL